MDPEVGGRVARVVEGEPAAVLPQVLDESDPDEPAPHPEGEQEPGDGAAELHASSIARRAPAPIARGGLSRRDARRFKPSGVPTPQQRPVRSPTVPAVKKTAMMVLSAALLSVCRPQLLRGRADKDGRPTTNSRSRPADVDRRRQPARSARHPGELKARRAGAPEGAHGAVLDRLGRRDRRGPRRAQRALAAAPASTLKMLFADTVLPKFPKTQKHKVEPRRPGGHRRGQQPGRHQGEPDVHGPRPVAGRVPAVRQRRGARPVGDERRRPGDRQGRCSSTPRSCRPSTPTSSPRTATTSRGRSPARTT